MNQKVPTVLVIDDAHDVAELMACFLARARLHAVIASNGLAGLQQAQAILPSLILCDSGAAGREGLQVIERLRADPATARVPIVLMSGHGTEPFDGSGADAFLQKPFLMSEMLAVTHRFVTRSMSETRDEPLECAA
jgi:chemosensory pili system protein ChpA (sensor histidine kinase/response regulator)